MNQYNIMSTGDFVVNVCSYILIYYMCIHTYVVLHMHKYHIIVQKFDGGKL